MKKKLILIGGGGHCRSCIDVIEMSAQYEIVGVLDLAEKVGQSILDYQIIGTDESISHLAEEGHHFFITIGQIGSSAFREKIFAKLKACNATVATIISPMSYVSKHAVIGRGTIVMHNALINANAKVGQNCIINTQALIEHDVVIEDHCHVSTAAVINGGVLLKEGSFLGSNAVTKDGVVSKKALLLKQPLFF